MSSKPAQEYLGSTPTWVSYITLLGLYGLYFICQVWVQCSRSIKLCIEEHLFRDNWTVKQSNYRKTPKRIAFIYANARKLSKNQRHQELDIINALTHQLNLDSVTLFDDQGLFLQDILDANLDGIVVPFKGVASQSVNNATYVYASEQAGKHHIVDTVHDLKVQVDDQKISVKDINVNFMSAYLEKWIPEPQLLIVLGGQHLSLHGFPPWQLRLCEIYNEKSSIFYHQPKLTYGIVKRALALYNGAHMKNGK